MSHYWLRQSTASQEVSFPAILSATDLSAQTGLTVANTDIKITKAGATAEVSKNSGGATHKAAGRYYCVLDATDTDTVGSGRIDIAMSGTLPVSIGFTVLAQVVYDVLFGTTAPSTYAGGAVASVTGAVGSVTGNVGGNVTGSVGSVTGNVGGNVVGSVASVTGAVGSVTGNVGGSVASVVGAVGSVTGAVGSVIGNVGGNVTGTVASVVGNVGGNVAGSVASVTNAVTVGTNNDKTGYALTAAYDAAKTASQFNSATDGVSLSGGSGSALVAAVDAAVTSSHGVGSYVRNTEPVDVSANVAAIKAKTDNLPAAPAAVGDIPTAAAIVIAMGAATVDGTVTRLQKERLELAALAGDASEDGTVYYAPDGTTPRLTVAADGVAGRTVTRTP